MSAGATYTHLATVSIARIPPVTCRKPMGLNLGCRGGSHSATAQWLDTLRPRASPTQPARSGPSPQTHGYKITNQKCSVCLSRPTCMLAGTFERARCMQSCHTHCVLSGLMFVSVYAPHACARWIASGSGCSGSLTSSVVGTSTVCLSGRGMLTTFSGSGASSSGRGLILRPARPGLLAAAGTGDSKQSATSTTNNWVPRFIFLKLQEGLGHSIKKCQQPARSDGSVLQRRCRFAVY